MARIRERKLPSGAVFWELTHGKEPNRIKIRVGSTEQEAKAVLAQFEKQLELHGEGPKEITRHEAENAYAEHLRKNRRPATAKRYNRAIMTFNVCFMDRWHPDVVTLRSIRPTHMEEYKDRRAAGEIEPEEQTDEERRREQELRLLVASQKAGKGDKRSLGWLGRHTIRKNVSQRTINYEILVLNTFFRWCIKKNWMFINPASGVERFRLQKKVLPKFMTTQELKVFFAACTDYERPRYEAILLSGMRKGEAEHLEWSDISFELGVIFIQAKENWKPKTDERLIPISPMLQEVLVKQWEQRKSDRWVFANEAGNIDIHLLERLKKICNRAEIRPAAATVHALRHSFGTHLRMAGISLADIADLMGHKDLATTQVYAKVLQEHLRDAVSKLAPLVKAGHVPQSRSTDLEIDSRQRQLPADAGNTRQTTND